MLQMDTNGPRGLVVQDNQLINARYNLSVAEKRLFLLMVVQLKKDDTGFQSRYKISVKDYMAATGTSAKSVYKELKETAKNLLSRQLFIPKPNGGWLQMNFISSAEYIPNEGVIELEFSSKLKPFLLELKARYTAYDIRNVMALQSSYSIRIYELLKQFLKIGERTFKIEDLRENLAIGDKYKSYNLFKKRVIEQAQGDLAEHCDIGFEFEEIKQGRRIAKIRFIIRRQDRHLPAFLLNKEKHEIIAELKDMGIAQSQAEQFAEELEEEMIRSLIAYTQEQYRQGKIKASISGYLIKLLELGAVPSSAFEIKEAEKQKTVKPKVDHEKQMRQKEQVLISELKEDFKELKDQLAVEAWRNATTKDWQKFAAKIQSNLFLSKKLQVDGKLDRENPEVINWFKQFAKDDMLSFEDWAWKEKSFKVAKDSFDPEVYRILNLEEFIEIEG